MIRVFILEDNEYKLQHIIAFLKNQFSDKVVIDYCKYFNEGVRKLIKGNFDYAVLDNNLPRFNDSSTDFVTDAAEDAIEWLELKKKDTKCIVCSSEPFELQDYHSNYIGGVNYQYNSVAWEKQLLKLITV